MSARVFSWHSPATRDRLLRIGIVLLAVVALVWLAYEFWRLLWQPPPMGAIDLRLRHGEVHRWFVGATVYRERGVAVYPPASYVVLWPFLEWNSITVARWIWAASSVAALVWLGTILIRECGAETRAARSFFAVMPLALYPTGATIGNGQLLVHVLPVLLTSLLLLRTGRSVSSDLLAACLFILALVKPSVTAPFFWVLLFAPGRWRPALLVLLGYAGMTVWATTFQEKGVIDVVHDWFSVAGAEVGKGEGYANVTSLLAAFGLEEWTSYASLIILLGSGIWIYCYRRTDIWLLIGVAALVSRFWTYHRWYDDLLILLPLIALLRIAGRERLSSQGRIAGLLAGCTLASLLAPGGLYLLPWPWNSLYVMAQVTTWVLVLVFLLYGATRHADLRPDTRGAASDHRAARPDTTTNEIIARRSCA